MKILPAINLLTVAIMNFGVAALTQAEAVDLDFSSPVGSSNGNHSLGPYYSSTVVNFLNVGSQGGQSIDMRITATASTNYSLVGSFADYGTNGSDLGVLYQANARGTGMLQYDMEFFTSGSNFTTRFTLNEFDLMIYDVDGEATQSEAVRAFLSDGLYSYRLADSPDSVTVIENSADYVFTGVGYNLDEHDSSAAVVLNFRNTDSIRLQFESNTTSPDNNLPNGIFSAVDGNPTINPGSFDDAVVVPEPSGALSLLVAGLIFIIKRRPRRS